MWAMDVAEALRDRGYTFEFEYGEWSYEWAATHVYSKDGRVFTLWDAGCSCSDFGDLWNTPDEVEGSLVEVSDIPALSDLGGYDETAESIQEDYRNLFRQLRESRYYSNNPQQ